MHNQSLTEYHTTIDIDALNRKFLEADSEYQKKVVYLVFFIYPVFLVHLLQATILSKRALRSVTVIVRKLGQLLNRLEGQSALPNGNFFL